MARALAETRVETIGKLAEEQRIRALERLYLRRAELDALIRSVENYAATKAAPSQRGLDEVVRLRSMANFTRPTKSCTLSLRMRPAR